MKTLSVIIPVGKFEPHLPALLKNLERVTPQSEVIVSCPSMVHQEWQESLMGQKLQLVHARPNRAAQLNVAAAAAKGEWLAFLHADSLIAASSWEKLESALKVSDARCVFYFELDFKAAEYSPMKLNEWGVRFRNRTWGVPYGDQGLIISASAYAQLGGYNESIDYGDDHEFIWRCRLQGLSIQSLDVPIQTSDRKYRNGRWLETSLRYNVLGVKQAWNFGWKKLIHKKLTGSKHD